MPNRDVPDFDSRTEKQQAIDAAAPNLRRQLAARGLVTFWDAKRRLVKAGYGQDEVQAYCVADKEWQDFRLTLKGKDTSEKLAMLEAWWDKYKELHKDIVATRYVNPFRRTEVQVGNYLGALRRGGQLDGANQLRMLR